MEYTNTMDMGWDIGMACIVFILYIVGKVWMYYKTNRNDKSDME